MKIEIDEETIDLRKEEEMIILAKEAIALYEFVTGRIALGQFAIRIGTSYSEAKNWLRNREVFIENRITPPLTTELQEIMKSCKKLDDDEYELALSYVREELSIGMLAKLLNKSYNETRQWLDQLEIQSY